MNFRNYISMNYVIKIALFKITDADVVITPQQKSVTGFEHHLQVQLLLNVEELFIYHRHYYLLRLCLF